MTVECPVCKQSVTPAPIMAGADGFFGAARFCPTPTGPMSRCETDLASCVGADGKRLMQAPTEQKPHELESSLQVRVGRYLDTLKPDVWWWRQSVGSAFARDGRQLFYGTPGMSDLVVCCRGMFLALELKSETGTQRPKQKEYEKHVRGAHGRYFLIRSVDEARAAVEATWGKAAKGASVKVYEAGIRHYQDEIEGLKTRIRMLGGEA